jgi:hypothetical protein
MSHDLPLRNNQIFRVLMIDLAVLALLVGFASLGFGAWIAFSIWDALNTGTSLSSVITIDSFLIAMGIGLIILAAAGIKTAGTMVVTRN